MIVRTVAIVLLVALLPWRAGAAQPCRIEVREAGSGWAVPLVELRTTNAVRLVSDNAGVIACDLPELMGQETWFEVIGHGYGVHADGLGLRGVRLTPRPGATLRVEVERTNLARRIGRLTGGGLFAESQKLGEHEEWTEQGVYGCDSVQVAAYAGKLFWVWGDSRVPGYGLGNFHSTGATTPRQPLERWEPPLALRYDYFRDAREHPRAMAKFPGDGPTWLSGCVTLPDRAGREHLVATYRKIRNHLDVYEAGLCAWNEEAQEFRPLRAVWKAEEGGKRPPLPEGHAVLWQDEQAQRWVLFGDPLPNLRCPGSFEAWQDPATWEVLTPQATLTAADGQARVQPHSGSIAWNEYRHKWVTIFVEKFGKPSALGEVWYAEAEQPTGPWSGTVKVLTHDNYTFYNPRLHPELTPAGSPMLLFEGSYTAEFANHPQLTPRYDYNQMLYRLDLDEPRLFPGKK